MSISGVVPPGSLFIHLVTDTLYESNVEDFFPSKALVLSYFSGFRHSPGPFSHTRHFLEVGLVKGFLFWLAVRAPGCLGLEFGTSPFLFVATDSGLMS